MKKEKKEKKDLKLTFRLKKSTRKMLDELNEWNDKKGLNELLELLVSEKHDEVIY